MTPAEIAYVRGLQWTRGFPKSIGFYWVRVYLNEIPRYYGMRHDGHQLLLVGLNAPDIPLHTRPEYVIYFLRHRVHYRGPFTKETFVGPNWGLPGYEGGVTEA